MKKAKPKPKDDELRPEYDLSKLKGGIRGKHLKRYRAGTNLLCFHRTSAPHFQPMMPSIRRFEP